MGDLNEHYEILIGGVHAPVAIFGRSIQTFPITKSALCLLVWLRIAVNLCGPLDDGSRSHSFADLLLRMLFKGPFRVGRTYRVVQKSGTRFNFAITSVNVHRF